MSIHIHIERVVLESAAAAGLPRFRRGLEQELTRLVREGGLSHDVQQAGAVPALRGGTVARDGAASPRFGAQVAKAVYQSIGDRS